MTIFLGASRARRAFKELLGNANHLIITGLVGLDAVERGIVDQIPDELRAAWSPVDPKASARRSRRLFLDMALLRAVDAIDVYIRESLRKPSLVQSPELRIALDQADLSVFKKLAAFARHYEQLDPLPLALANVMIAWRNRSAHTEADRDAPEQHLQVIRSSSDALAARFSGLDAEMLLSDFANERPPRFKEIASFINAAHHLVKDLDELQLSSLDPEEFLRDTIWVTLAAKGAPGEQVSKTRMRHAVSIWGKDANDRRIRVDRFLQHQGFSAVEPKSGTGLRIDEKLIQQLCERTPTAVLAWARGPQPEPGAS